MNLFDRLPVELLAQIISFAVQASNADQIFAGKLEQESSFLCSCLGVCRRWHDVTYATPSLWAVASLSTCRTFRRGLMKHKSRCGSLPLHLDLFVSHNHFYGFSLLPAEDTNPRSKLMSVRVIGKVNGDGTYFKAVGRVGDMPETCMAESLELVITGRTYNRPYPYLGGPLARAVGEYIGLRSLSLVAMKVMAHQGEEMSSRPTGCLLPHLEELLFKRCDGYALQLLEVLVTPALATLAIDCSTPHELEVTVLQRPLPGLPTVRNLVLHNVPTSTDTWTILSAAPNITRLDLPNEDPRSLNNLLAGRRPGDSLPTITHLVVNSSVHAFTEIRGCVASILPSLRTLELARKPGCSEGIELLEWPGDSTCTSSSALPIGWGSRWSSTI